MNRGLNIVARGFLKSKLKIYKNKLLRDHQNLANLRRNTLLGLKCTIDKKICKVLQSITIVDRFGYKNLDRACHPRKVPTSRKFGSAENLFHCNGTITYV
jgi:hypothetical protein